MPLIEEMEISAMYDGTVAVIAPQPSPVRTRPASIGFCQKVDYHTQLRPYTYKTVGLVQRS